VHVLALQPAAMVGDVRQEEGVKRKNALLLVTLK
jgi:hypothetical protein